MPHIIPCCPYFVHDNNNRGMNGSAADGCILRNCTMIGNSARDINGVCLNSVLENCIAYGNGNDERSTWQYWFDQNPLVSAVGYREKNIYTGNPGFVDAANGDYRLAAGSPCIDAGDNSYVTGDKDLAGNARIANGTVDIGCYEYGSAPVGGTTWYVNGSTGSDSKRHSNRVQKKSRTFSACSGKCAGLHDQNYRKNRYPAGIYAQRPEACRLLTKSIKRCMVRVSPAGL